MNVVGKCLCSLCAASLVGHVALREAIQTNPFDCSIRVTDLVDFGPAEDCNDQPQQHPRSLFIATLNGTAGSSVAAVNTTLLSGTPIVDLEHFQADAPLPQFAAEGGCSPTSTTTWQAVSDAASACIRYLHIKDSPEKWQRLGYLAQATFRSTTTILRSTSA